MPTIGKAGLSGPDAPDAAGKAEVVGVFFFFVERFRAFRVALGLLLGLLHAVSGDFSLATSGLVFFSAI